MVDIGAEAWWRSEATANFVVLRRVHFRIFDLFAQAANEAESHSIERRFKSAVGMELIVRYFMASFRGSKSHFCESSTMFGFSHIDFETYWTRLVIHALNAVCSFYSCSIYSGHFVRWRGLGE